MWVHLLNPRWSPLTTAGGEYLWDKAAQNAPPASSELWIWAEPGF